MEKAIRHKRRYVIDNWRKFKLDELVKDSGLPKSEVKEIIEQEKEKEQNDPEFENLKRIKSELKKEIFWTNVKKQFRKQECDYFAEEYSRIIAQFENTAVVLHTEKTQVANLIKTRILLDRSLSRQKATMDQVQTLEDLIIEEKKVPENAQDKDKIRELEEAKVQSNSLLQNWTREYKDLVQEIDKAEKALNTQRGSRVKTIQDSKTDFMAAVTSFEEQEERIKQGKEINIFRMAMEKEKAKIQEYFEYSDGELEQPLLNHETLKDDNE